MLVDILTDGIFAAVAAIGFGAISDPPLRAFPSIALLAAIGHALRFCLMTYLGVDIATVCLQNSILAHHVHAEPESARITGKVSD